MKKICITVLAGVCALTGFSQTAITDPGVSINGVTWATRNVDMPGTFAAIPESAGMFYQWGKNVGWSSTDPLVNSNGETEWDGNISSFSHGTEWEIANDPCPDGWRVPTWDEFEKLQQTSEWTTQNGVNGRTFTDTRKGHSIFFPAAGYRTGGFSRLDEVDITGIYWSSTGRNEPSNIYADAHVFWQDNGSSHNIDFRSNGYSVRCVKVASSGIANTKAAKLQIIIENGELKIENYESENVQIFDIAGRNVGVYCIRPNETINIFNLSAGIYIVKIGDKMAKFVKK